MSGHSRASQEAKFEFVRAAAFDRAGQFFLVRRRFDIARLAGLYEFPGARVERQNDATRRFVTEQVALRESGLVVVSSSKPPMVYEGSIGEDGRYYQTFTHEAQIRGGVYGYDRNVYQGHHKIGPVEAMNFAHLLTPECREAMGLLVLGLANIERPGVPLQPAV